MNHKKATLVTANVLIIQSNIKVLLEYAFSFNNQLISFFVVAMYTVQTQLKRLEHRFKILTIFHGSHHH